MHPLQIATIVLASSVLIAIAILALRNWSGRPQRSGIEPQKHVQFDSILGKCDIRMPVVGQLGTVSCESQIDGSNCSFSDCFSGNERDYAAEIELCLARIRIFYRLANNPEQIKICKKSLQKAFTFHEVLYPNLPLSIEVLQSGARLSHVRIDNEDQGSFTFYHPVFMGGATITMHVGSDGEIKGVGVP